MSPDEPRRWKPTLYGVWPGPGGEFVSASDFDALKLAHDALRSRLEAVQRAADGMTDALRTSPCARPSQPSTDGFGYTTVKDCVDSDNCGCDCGIALRAATSAEKEQP